MEYPCFNSLDGVNCPTQISKYEDEIDFSALVIFVINRAFKAMTRDPEMKTYTYHVDNFSSEEIEILKMSIDKQKYSIFCLPREYCPNPSFNCYYEKNKIVIYYDRNYKPPF